MVLLNGWRHTACKFTRQKQVNWETVRLSSNLLCCLAYCCAVVTPYDLLTCAASGRGAVEIDTSATSLVSSTNYAYASFPVDVVVYIRIQPSFIRFTCLPVSRVECLLRLPSVDVVFSSTKADLDSSATDMSTTAGKSSGMYLWLFSCPSVYTYMKTFICLFVCKCPVRAPGP